MSQINCPKCGGNANEYFYYLSCPQCGYEDNIEEELTEDEDY